MKYIYALIHILLLCITATAQSAKITNVGNSKLYFVEHDVYEDFFVHGINKKDFVAISVDSNGTFLDNAGPTDRVGIIIFPNEIIEISIQKGKHVFNVVNAKERNQDFLFLSATTSVNGPLTQVDKQNIGYPFVQDYNKWKERENKYFKMTKEHLTPPPENNKMRDSILYSKYIAKYSFYQEYKKQHQLTAKFCDFYEAYIKYAYLNSVMSGVIETADFDSELFMLDSFFKNESDLFSDKFLSIQPYRHFLYLYSIYKNKGFSENLGTHLLSTQQLNIPPASYNHLLYNIIRKADELQVNQNDLTFFYNHCTDKHLTNVIKEKSEMKLYDEKESGATQLFNIEKQKISLDFLWSQRKDKPTIYFIDFWASWCMPCMEELNKISKEGIINQITEEIKGVSFLYFSIDENINSWLKSKSKFESIMNIDNSFLIVNQAQSELVGKLKLNTIPRYVVFDNEGNLLDDDAPHPSSIGFEKYLKKMILKAQKKK